MKIAKTSAVQLSKVLTSSSCNDKKFGRPKLLEAGNINKNMNQNDTKFQPQLRK